MKNKNILLSVLVIAAIAAVAMALVPPPPVEQNLGTYDTRVDKYTESLCRNCHDTTTLGGVPTRHHSLVANSKINPTNGLPFGCQDCHPATPGEGQGILIERNCVDCHNGSAFWGNSLGAQINITRPHHINTSYDSAGIGQPAQTRQCNVCHGTFVANYNDSHYIPSYNTSFMITPYADFKAYNETSGKYWGGCYACHQNSSAESPSVLTQHDTHHGAISGWGREGGIGHQKDATPGRACTWCHLLLNPHNATVNITINGVEETVLELRNSTLMATDTNFEPGTTMPINGTGCEKCHSVQSIHNIQYSYETTKGQAGFGHIGNNSDCNGCHASWIAGSVPLQGAIIPTVDSVTPSVVLAGSANAITIAGVNFVNDAYTSVVSVDGVTYTPASITDTQIVVNIPALNAGVHTLQLVKGTEKSKLATLTVVSQVDVVKAKLASGTITITGTEFGPQPTADFADLGVFVTHTSKVKGQTTTTTFKATVISWTNTQIVVDAGTAAVNDKLTVKTLNGQDYTNIVKK
ncbi:MAG: hypothetical protein C3F06_00140 [Candidatus Methanoperedenaceae archaeon]|nr:MAG: hypothetical protein C3F06_00140 [Candidatus Methanoperedenaceae archaeon]